MNYFIILPNQLFDKTFLNNKYFYIIWENPHYFTKYNYNKKKLILHRSSMKYYYDYLIKNNFKCKYIEFHENMDIKIYDIFDPIDNIKLPNKYNIIENPNFLLNKELYKKYREKTKKFFFNSFYMWGKKQLNILPNIKSQDKLNRKSLPKNLEIPNIESNNDDKKYIDEAINYVNKYFKNNYGNSENFIFPVSHNIANKFINHFIKYKLEHFGYYQDAIHKDENYLFHSLLSSSINIGLINLTHLINKILNANTKINNSEAFIRQLFWREYQRYCYIYYDFDNKKYFNNNNKLDYKWYDGTTNIKPVDDCIKKAFNNGYLHHIERLMIIGNYMNLSGIKPNDGFKWFMEFSCDSYEWVMKQNVLDMVFFVSGGVTMRRPYISSSNYILKMSNYSKNDEWINIWNEKYKNFIINNEKKLYKYRYFYRIRK